MVKIIRGLEVIQFANQHLDALADNKPWSTICDGNPIGARKFAALLKPYGISSRDLRFSGRAYKAYKLEWFLNV